VDAFMCYKQKYKVVSLNLAHPVCASISYEPKDTVSVNYKAWVCTKQYYLWS